MSRTRKGIIASATALITGIVAAVTLTTSGSKFYEIPYVTQDIRYQAVPVNWEQWGPRSSLDGIITKIRTRMAEHRGGDFQLKARAADDWSRLRSLEETLTIFRLKLRNANPLEVWLIRAGKDGFTMRARGRDFNPAVATATEGTQAIDVVVGTLRKRHPNIRIGGIYACRNTVYGNRSQHAFSNAVDVTGTTAQMWDAAKDFLALHRQGYMPVSQILWWGRNLISGNGVYNHYNHIHFSGSPLLSGACRRAG